MPNVLLNRFWIWPVTLGLLATACVAFGLGLQDVVWPVSLSAQLLGLFFTVSGVLGLISAGLLLSRAVALRPAGPHGSWYLEPGLLWVLASPAAARLGSWPRAERRRFAVKKAGPAQVAIIASGAVAGIYVNATIVAYSFRYDAAEATLFAGFGLFCLGLAWRTLPAAWPQVSQYLKGVGISVTVLGAVASFWFQSFYLPENTQVGIQYGLTVVSVRNMGASRLVTLDLTMENQSSVTALTVGSMLEVFGLSYTKTGRADAVTGNGEQLNLNSLTANAHRVEDLPPNSAMIAAPRDLSIGFGEQQRSVPLALIRPVNDDSLLFPNDISSRDFVVAVPEQAVRVLDVQIRVQYARTTRLALGYPVDTHLRPRACRDDKRAAWYVSQSALVRFTRGGQILYSDWCASLDSPFIDWGIIAPHGTHESGGAVRAISSHLGIITSSRDEMFTLP